MTLPAADRPAQDTVLRQQWLAVQANTSAPAQALLVALARSDAGELANLFYDAMLSDPDARVFLNHEVVDSRLRASMQRWVAGLLGRWDANVVDEQLALQRHVGTVHARIGVRGDLVMRGARQIKQGVAHRLLSPAGADAAHIEAVIAACELIDLAVEAMTAQYFSSHEVAARADESYRTFVSSMNMSLERERQRTALLNWENQVLQQLMSGRLEDPLPPIGQSSFGLWIRHKAAALFSRGSQLHGINEAMDRIDGTLLPLCQRELGLPGGEELRRLLRGISSEVGQIRYLKDSLFDHLVDMEAGRDALTQLLNRRFLPSILGREIELSRQAQKEFSLLLIDVDHFKEINDRHGHDAGDRVLQHLGNVLVNAVRSGDFVFRYGGEEFLVIAVELSPAQALQVAEKIRHAVEQETFLLSNAQTLKASISVGVAAHDGHPDYQRLIERADQALYRAKQAGRNRCVLDG